MHYRGQLLISFLPEGCHTSPVLRTSDGLAFAAIWVELSCGTSGCSCGDAVWWQPSRQQKLRLDLVRGKLHKPWTSCKLSTLLGPQTALEKYFNIYLEIYSNIIHIDISKHTHVSLYYAYIHTHTHTHIYIYIYMRTYVYM